MLRFGWVGGSIFAVCPKRKGYQIQELRFLFVHFFMELPVPTCALWDENVVCAAGGGELAARLGKQKQPRVVFFCCCMFPAVYPGFEVLRSLQVLFRF